VKLSSRHLQRAFGETTRIVGIIKEVAPTKSVKTDADLGVGVYEKDYWQNPLYMAVAEEGKYPFHALMGSRGFGTQSLPSWNPFSLVKGFLGLKNRLGATKTLDGKPLEGNYAGEGSILGGVLIVRNKKVIWHHFENMGYDFPYDEIAQAITGEVKQSDAMQAILKESDAAVESMGQCDIKSKECA
jgi:hypothetical protein